MRHSTKLADAIHVLVLIATLDAPTSEKIAESVRTNPVRVRQLTSKLREAGLVETARGRAATKLARPAGQISMLDVHRAVEPDGRLLTADTHVNPECGYAAHIQYAVAEFYDQIEQAAFERMASITLADCIARFEERVAEERETDGS